MLRPLNVLLAAFVSPFRFPERPASSTASRTWTRRPNVVYVMSDELAYFELGHMGNPYIRTPNIDRFAAEGLHPRLRGLARVCAALFRSRVCTRPRLGPRQRWRHPLREGEPTIATMLKTAAMRPEASGSGDARRDSTGVPEEHGFDIFFGYYDQVHAHTFYPAYGAQQRGGAAEGQRRWPLGRDVLALRDHGRGPRPSARTRTGPSSVTSITPPHGMYDIPADDPVWALYEDDEWMQRDGGT